MCIFAACVCVASLLHAASFDERVETLFRPPLAEMISLSPDGQRVAYTSQPGRDLLITIQNFEHLVPKRVMKVEPYRDHAVGENAPPAQLRFLRWATATRLVFAPTEQVIPLPPVTDSKGHTVPNPDGPTIVSPILVADADGKQRGTLIDAPHFQETPAEARRSLADLLRTTKELQATRSEAVRWRMPHLDILGFLPSDREQLVIQTRGAYSIPSQHLVDIRTGSVSEFGGDWPMPPGEPLVFDWYRLKVVGERKDAARPTTTWRDEELARVQRELELKFPRRNVELLDWNETRTRMLFRVTGGSDPGRIFVFQRPEDLPLEILRRAPWLNAAKLNETRFFEFKATDGAQLSGYLTWPAKPRLMPPPLLVVFPSGFPGQAQRAFDPESQVFADLGFTVARLNHRSVGGVRPEDLNALRDAADRVSVEDARAVIDWIAQRNSQRPFDRKRVATLGRGYGGYLAVRALQLDPAVFRCAISIDGPMELRDWLRPQQASVANSPSKIRPGVPAALIDHATADWRKLSVIEQAETLTKPVLLAVEPRRSPAIDISTGALRARLQGLGRAPDYLELDPGFAGGMPSQRASVYRKIDDFLNLHLHGFAVTIGATEEAR